MPPDRATIIIVNYACEYVFHIKIVSTFATVMMKYIFCILLGVFLNWGFHLISDEAQEAYRLETGSTAYKPIPIHTPPKPASYSWIKNRN